MGRMAVVDVLVAMEMLELVENGHVGVFTLDQQVALRKGHGRRATVLGMDHAASEVHHRCCPGDDLAYDVGQVAQVAVVT